MKTKLVIFGFVCIVAAVINYFLSFPSSLEWDLARDQLTGNGNVGAVTAAHARDLAYFATYCVVGIVGIRLFLNDLIKLVINIAKDLS